MFSRRGAHAAVWHDVAMRGLMEAAGPPFYRRRLYADDRGESCPLQWSFYGGET